MPWMFPNLEHKKPGQREINELGTTQAVEVAGAAVCTRASENLQREKTKHKGHFRRNTRAP